MLVRQPLAWQENQGAISNNPLVGCDAAYGVLRPERRSPHVSHPYIPTSGPVFVLMAGGPLPASSALGRTSRRATVRNHDRCAGPLGHQPVYYLQGGQRSA